MFNVLLRNLTLVVLLALLSSTAYAQERSPRVRAKEPTVVTVEEKKDPVREDERRAEERKNQNVFTRAIHGLGRGVLAVGHGIGRWINGMGDSDEVIPSAEERRGASDRKNQ